MEPLIEFEWETFLEEDDKWDALFVRINKGRWVMAQPAFGTENEQEIIGIILNGTGNWK